MTPDRLTQIETTLTAKLFPHGGFEEVRELIEAVRESNAVLRAYEAWEGAVILSDEAWAPRGMATLPRIPQELWDRLIEIQGMRNKVLGVFQSVPTPARSGE